MALLNYESIIDDMDVSQEFPSRPNYIPFQEYDTHGGGIHGEKITLHGAGGSGGDGNFSVGRNNFHTLISLAWHNKAVCLSRLGRTDEALVAAVQALKMDIHNHKMIMNVAVLLAEGQQFSEVCRTFSRISSCIQRQPTLTPSQTSSLSHPRKHPHSHTLAHLHHNTGGRSFR